MARINASEARTHKNPKTLSTYLGHATITITFDRYGHLMPGSEVEARAMLDAYLAKPGD